MSGIKAGVTVMNKFVSAGSKAFFGYIDYMDRKEARAEHFHEFNLFNDYMGNPEKSTGIFTKNSLHTTDDDLQQLKDIFSAAQENGSLLWQTVISFDNRWLAENGIYDFKQQVLDEKKLKEVSTIAISKMLHSEGLDNAVWTASIHYNTDNIHIHVGTVEPVPLREKKLYAQYTYEANEKNRLRKDQPILGKDGEQIYQEEYKGKFKQKSLQACKQHIVNEITSSRELNFKINRIIRDVIVKDIKGHSLASDPEFVEAFLRLRSMMPDCPKNLWNYNNNIMLPLRGEIDQLSYMYIEKYHKDEFNELKSQLNEQQLRYRVSYGDTGSDYTESKLKDLYSRTGNAILKSVREMDLKLKIEYEELDPLAKQFEDIKAKNFAETDFAKIESDLIQITNHEEGKIASSAKYRLGKEYLSGINVKKDIGKAISYLHQAADEGNQFAQYTLGKNYLYGNGLMKNQELATELLTKSALQGNEFAKAALGNDLKGKSIQLKPKMSRQTIMKLNHAMVLLKRGLNNSMDSYRNQRDFEELQHKIDYEKSIQGR